MAREYDTPPNRAIQWEDLSKGGRREVSNRVREAGLNLTTSVGEKVDQAKQASVDPSRSAASRKTASVNAQAWSEVQPHIQDKPVTLQTAANARQRSYERAEKDSPGHIPSGVGWYYEHHRDIQAAANQHGWGHDVNRVITASAVMSPQNAPENEKAAVTALMDAHANAHVHVDHTVSKYLGAKGIDVSHLEGQTVHADSLPVGSLAHLSGTDVRDKVRTNADLYSISRGGTKGNITKAERVLLHYDEPEHAINPHTAPKLWSYNHSIQQAVPESAEHVEHMTRAAHHSMVRSGHISPHQEAMDLYGGRTEHSPLLSPNAHTVEDTWMNAATFDQPKTLVGSTGKTSVHKTMGSIQGVTYSVPKISSGAHDYRTSRSTKEPDEPFVGPSAVQHAFNNRATRKAADQLSRSAGPPLPPTAVQEAVWNQNRRESGKGRGEGGPTLSDIQGEAQTEHARRQAPGAGQQALIGEHVPGRGRVGGSAVHTDEAKDDVNRNLSATQQEKELRSAGFAHDARRRRGGSAERMARLERHSTVQPF